MTEAQSSAISRMRVGDIMTKSVRTASPSATLREVAEMMRNGDMGAVPIVDENKLVGIVTDRDIVVRGVSEGLTSGAAISEVMTTELFTVTSDEFAFEAIRLMGDKQIRRIPVVNADGSLAGIVAIADIALEMEDEQEIASTLEEISSGASFWSKK
ncbi:MAG TPA: CBS domain-containing protein [Pyrinomonadaceae bacterium]|nr:CBS domain-containing protein [Pyrinomonadaceae bacterium]